VTAAAQESMWLMQSTKDLNQSAEYAVYLHCGNQSAIRLAENPVCHEDKAH